MSVPWKYVQYFIISLHVVCTIKISAIFYTFIARLVSHRNRYDILFIIARLVYHRNTCSFFINLLHVECTIELWEIFLHVKHVRNCIDLLHFKYVQYFISIESCNCIWFIDKDSIYTYILHHLETSIWLGFYICTNRKLWFFLHAQVSQTVPV